MAQGTGQRGGVGRDDDGDLDSEVEAEMRSSGRAHIVPRQSRPISNPQLNGSGRDADQHDLEEQVLLAQEALEATEPGAWASRAGAWLRRHRGGLALVAGAAVITAVGFVTAARARS